MPTGIPGLDEMCGGGVFESSTTLITGPSGTGKTTFCMHFVKEGLKNGERALFISFEESRAQLLRDAMVFSWGLEEYEQKGLLTFVCKYPEGAFLDEHLSEFKKILKTFKPKRLVIDSISSLQSSFTEKELGKFSKKILSLLKEEGITSFLTTATVGLMSTEMLSESHLSIFTDNILLLKYVETGGALSTVVSVIKTRGSHHDNKLRTYEITPDGVVLGGALSAYEGIMAGATRKVGPTTQETLKEEFVRTLGPMGEIEFYKLARKTLSRKGITKYIDSLLSDGILKKAKAKKFKENCVSILMEDHAEPFIATGGE
ncbi:MAG: AAA family ATPase [Candidatus Diapherotrites archaeon]|nr:AAA family ATPase [Candidatus Diapherotrites archaeon]